VVGLESSGILPLSSISSLGILRCHSVVALCWFQLFLGGREVEFRASPLLGRPSTTLILFFFFLL
jgi:hypothetical protein